MRVEGRFMIAQSYKNLMAWQKGMDLVKEVYIITSRFPKTEIYILTPQNLRSASIHSVSFRG